MNQSFAGKKLLVVGGTSGMGLKTAQSVLEQGGSAVIVGQRDNKPEAARKTLSTFGPVDSVNADVASAEGLTRVLQTIEKHAGAIDLLLNAAVTVTDFVAKPACISTPDR